MKTLRDWHLSLVRALARPLGAVPIDTHDLIACVVLIQQLADQSERSGGMGPHQRKRVLRALENASGALAAGLECRGRGTGRVSCVS